MGVCNCQRILDDFPANVLLQYSQNPHIVSPSSIRNALGVAYLGSNGETAEEMQHAMKLNGNKKDEALQIRPEENVSLTFIYVNKTLELAPEFKRLVTDEVQASVTSIDLSNISAERKIQDLIEKGTQNLTKKGCFDRITDGGTTAVVVNILNLENELDKPFKEGYTINRIPMMHRQDDFLYGEIESLNAEAVVLEFKNSENKILLLLPDENQSASDVRKRLSNTDINSVLGNLKRETLNVYLPIIDMTDENLLESLLKNLDVFDAFDRDADFTSMFKGKENSYIHKVTQSGRLMIDTHRVSFQSSTILQLRSMSFYKNLQYGSRLISKENYQCPEIIGSFGSKKSDFKAEEKPPGNFPDFITENSFVYAITNSHTVMAVGVVDPGHGIFT